MVNVRWFGVKADGTTDDTTTGQAAVDYVNANALGFLYCPAGTYLWNIVVKSDVIFTGDGRNSTIYKPKLDDHVFKTITSASVVRIGFHHGNVVGDITFTNQDGVHLETTTASTFVNNISFVNFRIDTCGQHGLFATGSSTAGPFVQAITSKDLFLRDCEGNGLRLQGLVLESVFMGGGCVDNGSVDGTIDNSYLGIEGGKVPNRVKFVNFRFNHAKAILDAGYTSAVIAKAVNIVGAQQVNFDTCDLESANPMIGISNAFSQNITVDTCNFTSNDDAVSYIEIDDVEGLKVTNSNFGNTATITTAYINNGTAAGRVSGVEIDTANKFTTGVQGVIIANEHTIATGAIGLRATGAITYITVDTESAAAADDLDSIFDIGGTAVDRLIDGQIVVASSAANTRDVTVTQNGNIALSTSSFVMDNSQDTIMLVWVRAKSLWLEVSTANNA